MIKKLLQEGVLSLVKPHKDQFISNVFIIPKPDGSHRLVINLKSFNEFVRTSHFKLETHKTVSQVITPNCYMQNIDLQDAYYLVPIHNRHKKYLRFRFKGSIYEYNCLPFGLSCAPQVFTKILRPVIYHLRKNGFLSVNYLDDFLLLGKTRKECALNTRETIRLLEHLGFLINYKKSALNPDRICKFLGFQYNSSNMTISLPQKKRAKLKKLIQQFSTKKACVIREFSKFIGNLVSAAPAIRYGFLYIKLFEREKLKALNRVNGNYDAKMNIAPHLSPDFSWWLAHIDLSYNYIHHEKFAIEIFSDASKSGWGAHCDSETIFGFWSTREKHKHINELELLAALFALKCFSKNLSNCHVLCRIDNTTAVSTINRFGSVKFTNLNRLARKIWNYCEEKQIIIFASYINSTTNVDADRASRQVHMETEWSLSEFAFSKIVDKFGVPKIDLFASRINKKCEIFISWLRDPEAYNVDAFTLHWQGMAFYAFPPFSLILKVLQKIIKDKAEGIIVVPQWCSQPWYPIFKTLLIGDPLIFTPNMHLLSFSGVPHPLWRNLTLVAGKLSGRRYYKGECP
ncbi:unnamed protein product [Callosobruchus maculatus]|uniref:Reverse transcriptase domain-containing protein n=1 Tax=Callosobruchus maculatus TaxID=64391 RepID=A0A653DMR1_CALMS|nr:unnamed protein product [Callosobruchus maculatus]